MALPVFGQWGLIKEGVDAARGAKKEPAREPAKPEAGATPQTAPGGPVLAAPTLYKNTGRNFSVTLPAGWEPIANPNGLNVSVMKSGTTRAFIWHITRMVPSFPAKASVDASLKTAKEEVTIGKLLSAKRRDQAGGAGKKGVIGWEIVESATGGGGSHQRIIWQCYDGDNYYYNFMTATSPEDFNAARGELQSIINSVKFGN
jgi:hypothetical protein